MLQNAYFLAKIGADTADNDQHFAEILPKTGNYPTGPPSQRRAPRPPSSSCRDAEAAAGVAGTPRIRGAR